MHIKIMEENDSLASETSTFRKWIRQSYPDVTVSTPENKARYQLNDHSLLLPFVQLVTSPDLVNYLNLVREYMNFKFRGSMRSDTNTIEVCAEVTNGPNGESKRFHFKGTADDYSQTVEKFDPNAFFNGG
ncbi:hypothetical protein [Vibrio sp. 10N.261.51.F12]|uniref:hypothetical protein n=1 Tax=Vibrio sp. 10N.261.51.F12 TaxID=3229679 RepID=UPI00354DFB7A